MTIDERLEKLTARHEALAESVELLTHNIDSLRVSVSELVATANQDGENIRALARIAEIHERRLTGLEDGAK